VDFSRVASSAEKAGFQVLGFASQARFLINAGLLHHAQAVLDQAPDVAARARLTQSLQTLLSESEMGEAFKVMLLAKGLSPATSDALAELGFADGNRLEALLKNA
jgi:SAM-dependent MidA family methyltransferase